MKLTITMQMDNSAFQDDGADGKFEAARILRWIATGVENGSEESSILDINGNKVGRFDIED